MHTSIWMALAMTLGLSSHAIAQDIAFADLRDHTITASILYAQTIRRLDDGRIFNNQNRQTVTLKIRPGDLIDQIHAVNITRNGKEIGSNATSATFELNKPRKGRFGEIIWLYDQGDLVRLQTFETGGRRITISFKRSGPGFSCSVAAPFAKEEGAGNLKTDAAVGNVKIEILDAKQTSSACKVARTAA